MNDWPLPRPGNETSPASDERYGYYEVGKFLVRDEKEPGKLLNCYQQRMMLVSEDFVVAYQQALEQEVGDAAGEIMYRCGFEWGRADITQFEKRFAQEFGTTMTDMPFGMVLESWWWPLQAAGWGAWRYDLSNQREGLIFIDLFESAVARSIGNVGKVVCHYYAGLFAAVFSHIARRELSGIEIQCYSMGEEYCKFLIGAAKRISAAQFWAREGATAQEIIQRL